MIRISVPWLIDTVAALNELDAIAESDTIEDIIPKALSVQVRLGVFYIDSMYSPYLKVSSKCANELYSILEDNVIKSHDISVSPEQLVLAQIKGKKK